jgi:hypothetical protein
MSVFLLHFRTAWSDYFPATTTTNLNQQTYYSRPSPSGSNIYVLNCLFISISSTSGHGGALYLTSVTYFLVESTSFFSCKTSSGYGGAIFSSGGQSVLHTVCGYDCLSTHSSYPYYQFTWVDVNNAISSKNYVNYSSISRCVNVNSGSHQILRLFYGKILCPSVNISMNKCGYYSGICCDPFKESNSITCLFTYSTFADNIANGYTCITLVTTGAEYEIKSCNIFRNTQSSSSDGILRIFGHLMIENSCILENKATNIFFTYSSYTITLSNCTVDSTSNNGYLTIRNTVTESFILALNHMSTRNCNSEYDSVGTLTPIIQTPSSSKKQIQCCTCGKCLDQSPLMDVFSLHNILIFNFIHPCSSINHL